MRRGAVTLILCLAFLGATFLWRLRAELHTPYLQAAAEEVFVDIPKGATSSDIAELLAARGVLRRKVPFLLYTRWSGAAQQLQAGEYRFTEAAAPVEIVSRLARGDIYFLSVTIPEGMTARETAGRVVRQGLGDANGMEDALRRVEWIRDLDPAAQTLEGYLFPDTYRFPRTTASAQVVLAMVRQFHSRIDRLLRETPPPPGRTIRDIVILASIVEKETQDPAEMGLVASVLANRLKRRIPLACDPTVIYALKLAGVYDGNIRKADLSIDSPYNTYTRVGLPPGPIANPGEDALRAALAPPDTPYLYFVSRNDGTHHFSRDFRSHQEAVERYQKKR
ncbi:MAG: endolytic transglycosylase MltG [Acidobacteriota bacterium]